MSAPLPFITGRFEVRIAELSEAQFTEVTIPEISHTPIEYRQGKDPELVLTQLIGMRKYGEGSLKEGNSSSKVVFDWFTECIVEGKDTLGSRNGEISSAAVANLITPSL